MVKKERIIPNCAAEEENGVMKNHARNQRLLESPPPARAGDEVVLKRDPQGKSYFECAGRKIRVWIPLDSALKLKKGVLKYLAPGAQASTFLVGAQISVFCHITKYGKIKEALSFNDGTHIELDHIDPEVTFTVSFGK